jgi:hypothetical protein
LSGLTSHIFPPLPHACYVYHLSSSGWSPKYLSLNRTSYERNSFHTHTWPCWDTRSFIWCTKRSIPGKYDSDWLTFKRITSDLCLSDVGLITIMTMWIRMFTYYSVHLYTCARTGVHTLLVQYCKKKLLRENGREHNPDLTGPWHCSVLWWGNETYVIRRNTKQRFIPRSWIRKDY